MTTTSMDISSYASIKSAKRGRWKDRLQGFFVNFCAAFSVCLVFGIILYVFYRGLPSVNLSFLTGVTSVLNDTVGIAGNIVNTVYMIILTLLIVTPIGVGSAIYIEEYAKPGKFVDLISFTTETLSGIPSIIFGLFGMVFFGETLHLGYTILTGALTLSLMTLPLITKNTQEALRTIPVQYRQGAIGMGAPKWYMIRTILLPTAMPGILTGMILAIGRIVGESAALMFTAGSSYLLPKSILGHILEGGGTLTIQLYLSMQKAEYSTAFGIAAVLLIIVLAINFLTRAIVSKPKDQQRI